MPTDSNREDDPYMVFDVSLAHVQITLKISHRMTILTDQDGRANLGVRSGGRPTPILDEPTPIVPSSASDPRPRYSSRPILTLNLPGRTVSGNSTATVDPLAPSPQRRERASPSETFKQRRRQTLKGIRRQGAGLVDNQGLYETQKLLSLLLDRLQARPPAPDLLDRAAFEASEASGAHRSRNRNLMGQLNNFGDVVISAAKGATGDSRNSRNNGADGGEEHINLADTAQWDTDVTFDLIDQTRDVLVKAEQQGFDLFGASHIQAAEAARTKASDKRKGSLFTSPFASSPNNKQSDDSITSGPILLSRLCYIVQQLLTVDCIHVIQAYRPFRPPYALQAACLDLAAVIYQYGDIATKLTMMESVVEGWYGMGDILTERICQWLEGRMGELLRRLAVEREIKDEAPKWNDPFSSPPPASPDVPTFAFSVAPEPGITATKPGWMRYSPVQKTFSLGGILSTHSTSGKVSPIATQISGIVPRILVAITSTVDLSTATLTTIYQVHRLISLVLSAKPDAALDLMEIVAHGPTGSRRRGLHMLATYFPQAMGHNVIARRTKLATYDAHLTKWESGQEKVLGEDDTEGHHYVPWCVQEGSPARCMLCRDPITDFCARCTLCHDMKHYECLQLPGKELFRYGVIKLGQQQQLPQVAVVRFSLCSPRLDERVLYQDPRVDNSFVSTKRKMGQHRLHLVNLFSTTLCAECHEPLWGSTAQAYACTSQCQRLFHPDCVQEMMRRGNQHLCLPGSEVVVTPTSPGRGPFTTTVEVVRSSFQRLKSKLFADPEEAATLTFDELSLINDNLQIQYQLYKNGLASGCLYIEDADSTDPSQNDIPGFEELLRAYDKHLASGQLEMSSALVDYSAVVNEEVSQYRDLLWRPRYLQYCAALLRAPSDPSTEANSPSLLFGDGLLTVDKSPTQRQQLLGGEDEETIAYEAVRMPTISYSLSIDLGLKSALAGSILVEQMRSFGLCAVPACLTIDIKAIRNPDLLVTFPLPLLMDATPSVETLVLVIERLLDDIDLTDNEHGLILMFNRAWPNSICSPYALERLGGAVMSWVMSQDEVLHHIVKNYATQRQRLPGVRNAPGGETKGQTAMASYKADRIALLKRYVRPWLRALHDLDPSQYASLAYDKSKTIDNRYEVLELERGEKAASQIAGFAMERLAAMGNADVLFSAAFDLLTAWLEDLGSQAKNNVVYKSLPRLLRQEKEQQQQVSGDATYLWELAQDTSAGSQEGMQRVCRWMRVLAFSGVEIPWAVINGLVDLVCSGQMLPDYTFDLVSAINANVTPIEPAKFADIANGILASLTAVIQKRPRTTSAASKDDVDVLRMCLKAILRAYNAPAEEIAKTSLAPHDSDSTAATPVQTKKRRPTVTLAGIIPLNADTLLAAAGMLRRQDYPAELILDFLWLLLVKSSGAQNADAFLHQSCSALYEAIWPLYDRNVDRQSRSRVFLKLLTINREPIERLVSDNIERMPRPIIRERLLTFILELADESVAQGPSGWRGSAVELIFLFFNRVVPPTEANPENIVIWKSLQPLQLRAISCCFEEYLQSCSDEQRLHLLARLQNLWRYLPSWGIVNWETLEQLLIETFNNVAQLEKSFSEQGQLALSEVLVQRASLLSLGLKMLSGGVSCKWATLLRFQQHVAAACALPWPVPESSVTDIILPALMQALDSKYRIVKPTIDEKQKAYPVGSQFVSIVMDFAQILPNQHNFITQRYILDILLVIFFKHKPSGHNATASLEAVALHAKLSDCIENRLLALKVLKTAQTHMGADHFSGPLPRLFVAVCDIMFKETQEARDPAVIEACRDFILQSMTQFGRAQLFLHVLHEDSEPTEYPRPHGTIGRVMQFANREVEVLQGGDTQSTAVRVKNVWLEQVIEDLPVILRWGRKSMNMVLVSLSHLAETIEDDLTDNSAHEYASFLGRLTRAIPEWDARDFDPNPVLRISAAFLKHSPHSASQTVLHQIASFLDSALDGFDVELEPMKILEPIAKQVAVEHAAVNTVESVIFDTCQKIGEGHRVTPLTLRTIQLYCGSLGTDQAKPIYAKVLFDGYDLTDEPEQMSVI